MNALRPLAMVTSTLLWSLLLAQPGAPDLSFTVVRDTKGRPMRGPYAENAMMREALRKPHVEPWTVEIHFTLSKDYPYAPEQAGKHEQWVLTATPLQDGRTQRLWFSILDCWCTDLFVLIMQGQESMRIDLPDASPERWALVQHVMQRSGDLPSPEVIRFRPGRFTYAELMNDPVFDELEARLADRLNEAANTSYQKQLADLEEYYCTHPPTPAPAPAPPTPPALTQEQWEAEMAKQPGLQQVEVDRMNADTVWVRITGRVMLDGGCASGMPLFGVEMLTDTGWVERIPFDLTQMDCGMPWADWDQHVVMLPPLRWWVGAHQPEGRKELLPGTYRLMFVGGNAKNVRTDAFSIGE